MLPLAAALATTACSADDVGMTADTADGSSSGGWTTFGSESGDSDSGAPGMGPSYQSFRPIGFDMDTAERVIVLGDSVGQGEGASQPELSFVHLLVENDDDRWPEETGHDLETYFGELPNLVNAAVGGSTSHSMVQEQLPEIEQRLEPPVTGHSIVLITVGGNDLIAWLVDPHGSEDALVDDIVTNVRQTMGFFDDQRFPGGVSFIINTVYDPSDGTGQAGSCFKYERSPEVFDRLRSELIAVGMNEGAAVADTLSHFEGHGITADGQALWFADCVHPNNQGHHELRRMIYELVDTTHPVAGP